MTMFKTPVYVKPLGLIVHPSMIGNLMRLGLRREDSFELVRDGGLETDATVRVRRSSVITAFVETTLSNQIDVLDGGVAAFNDALEERIELAVEDELRAEREPEPAAPKKRGRKSKAELAAAAEADEDEPEDEDTKFERRFDEYLRHEFSAHSFDVTQLTLHEEAAVPLQHSTAYVAVTGEREDFKEKIDQKLGQLTRLVAQRNTAMSSLTQHGGIVGTDADPAVAAYTDDLEDSAVRTIDQAGLGVHRQNMRDNVDGLSNSIREVYDWLDRNVLARYAKMTSTEPQVALFNEEEVVFGTETLNREEIFQDIFREVFVPVHIGHPA